MAIINRVVKGIGAGIGLASEAIAHRKEKKGKEQGEASTDRKEEQAENEIDSDLDEDELAWRLDEASEAALQSNEKQTQHGTTIDNPPEYTVDGLVDDFLAHHPPPTSYTPSTELTRPMLAECGIDQETFLEFLDSFDKSTQASPYLTAINVAAMAVGFVPNPIIMAVTISVQVAVGTAQVLQSRHRTNSFLDRMNETLFRPHGLYCLLMTFKPNAEAASEPVLTANLVSKNIEPTESKIKEQMRMFRLSSGKTRGELELPEGAPLVFPVQDVKEGQGKFKSSSRFGELHDRPVKPDCGSGLKGHQLRHLY